MPAEDTNKAKTNKAVQGKTGAEAEGHLARQVEIENVVKTSGDPEAEQEAEQEE